jgi:hypothetical protein
MHLLRWCAGGTSRNSLYCVIPLAHQLLLELEELLEVGLGHGGGGHGAIGSGHGAMGSGHGHGGYGG